MEFKSMDSNSIGTVATKFARTLCPDILKVVVSEPWMSKKKTGFNMVVKVIFETGAVGTVALFKGNESVENPNPTFSKMMVQKTMPDGTKKPMGYVSFGNDFIGGSYFKAIALVDMVADMVVCCM